MAKYIFKDMAGFSNALGEANMKAMKDTLEECLEKLYEIIEEDIYSLPESEWYERTKNLLNAFYLQEPKRSGGIGRQIYGYIKYKPRAIKSNPKKYQHGSPTHGKLDGWTFLSIMNNEYPQGDMFPHVDREPMLDDFWEWLDKHYNEIYQKNLEKYIK